MSHPWERTSADVEAAAESERADLAQTLDKLRENLQPRNVVDEVMTHAGVNTTNVTDQIASFARSNPVAAAIVGIGAAMFFGTRRDTTRSGERSPSGAASGTRFDPDDRRDVPGRDDGVPRGASASDADLWQTREVAGAEDGQPLMNTVSVMRTPKTGLARLIDEQPLVLAALGVAVGAAIGAALPPTVVESQLMGDANEALRRNAKDAARAQLAQIRATATNTFEQMKTTVADHGATSENLYGLVHDLGDDVRSASQSLGPRPPGTHA